MATTTATFTTVAGLLLHEDRGGTESSYTPDPLGSLIEARNSLGTRTYSAEYWPYGEIQASSGSNPSSWGFVGLLGYFADSATMLYVRARYLLSKLVRWLTVDPLWPRENPYGYVKGNPVTLSDKHGLRESSCGEGSSGEGGGGGGLTPCTDLLTGGLEDLPPDLLKCLLKAKGNKEEQEKCIKEFGKSLRGKAAAAIIQYLACIAASDDCSGLRQNQKRMNPCSDPTNYGLACCHMKYLACMMNCLREKYSDVDLGACLLKCYNNSVKCAEDWDEHGC